MQITIIANDLLANGGTRIICALANQIATDGHKVKLITLKPCEPAFPLSPLIQLLIPTKHEKVRWFLHCLAQCKNSDITLATFYTTSYVALIAKALAFTRKTVYLVQADESKFPTGKLKEFKKFAARLSYRLPTKIITNSTWTRDRILSYGAKTAISCPIGYDEHIFPSTATKKNHRIICTIGRIHPDKQFSHFIKLTQHPKLKDHTFICLTPDQEIELICKNHQIRTLLSPAQEAISSTLADSKYFISTSLEEGFSLPPLEAMAQGCIVVSTNSGGINEYATHGQNCYLVDPRLTPEDFADTVADIISNRNTEVENKLQENSLKTARRFTLRERIQKIANEIYHA